VTVERPLRLHSQLAPKAIESLRFASGDEEIRAALHDELGDALFTDFAPVKVDLEKRLLSWGNDEAEDDADEDAPPRRGLPDKKRKKRLDAKTWERDGRLVEAATALRAELGGDLFEDHNRFRDAVEAALKKLGLRLGAADLKTLYRAVIWRVETAVPVFAKVHRSGKATADPLRGRFEATVGGKACVVEYEPASDLRDTEQVPLLEPGGGDRPHARRGGPGDGQGGQAAGDPLRLDRREPGQRDLGVPAVRRGERAVDGPGANPPGRAGPEQASEGRNSR
jgi:type I restriction enzyme M protein